jgi:hypothetical protein
MKEGYGNFFTDVILIAKCKKEMECIELGSEVSKVKLDTLLEPLYIDLKKAERKLETICDKSGVGLRMRSRIDYIISTLK